jgi:hypothetical protein
MGEHACLAAAAAAAVVSENASRLVFYGSFPHLCVSDHKPVAACIDLDVRTRVRMMRWRRRRPGDGDGGGGGSGSGSGSGGSLQWEVMALGFADTLQLMGGEQGS